MKKTIRTVQGKTLDMAELILKNEKSTAVGNMNVDAKGNTIKNSDSEVNNTVASRTRRDSKNYRRQINKRVFDLPVQNSKDEALKDVNDLAESYAKGIKNVEVIEGLNTITVKEIDVEETVEIKPAPIPVKSKHSTEVLPKANPRTDKVSDEFVEKVLNTKNIGGLAGALAKKKEINKRPIKSPREQLRASDGVKKI